MGEQVLGKTRWRRFALAFGIPGTVIAAILALAASGAMAIPVTISGLPFTLSGNQLNAQNFSQYGDVDVCAITALCPDVVAGGPLAGANVKAVGVTTIGTLNDGSGNGIVGLDQVVCGPTGFGTPANLKIEITGDTVAASNLVADITALNTNSDTTTTFTNLSVGIPLTQRSSGSATFGQTASSFTIGTSGTPPSFKQTAVYTSAGTFAVKHLNLAVSFVSSC
jgi:hypothetical protein